MNRIAIRSASALLSIVIASLVVACARDDVVPADVEKQAFEDLRTEVRDVIDDPTREADAIRLLSDLEVELGALRMRVADRKKRVRQLNANYDTPRAEFEVAMQQANREIRENRQRAGAGRRAFMNAVTTEEFSEIKKSLSKAMQATIKSYQAI